MGNNSLDSSPLFFATSGPTKRRKHYVCLLFSQYWVGVESTSKSPHFSDKSIPGLPRLEPHRKVNATTLYTISQTFKTLRKTANLFSNLVFLPKSEFPKTLDLSMDFPRIFHGGRRPTKNVPGGTERRMHLTVPSSQKTKKPIVETCLDGLGRLGVRKNHTRRCL